ncbi:MAG: hypothetical protein K0B05_12520, partial [Bacteroidales bacterium]|nr:hypothetical protein [Bacteroidales bacterium]
NINSSGRFGRAANFVNTKSRNYNNIRDAMLSGKHFALMMPIFTDEEYKLQRNLNLPAINYLDLTGDTVKFSVSEPATINVFGQKGLLKYSFSGVTGISIPFTPEDTYLRFAAIFADGVILYTNPLVRFNGKQIAFQTLASVNYPLTIVQFLLISTLLAVSLRFFWIILRKMVTQRMT